MRRQNYEIGQVKRGVIQLQTGEKEEKCRKI